MKPKSWVKAGAEWIATDTEKLIFVDIEETPFGDEMTFDFNGVEYKSLVVYGSKPGN